MLLLKRTQKVGITGNWLSNAFPFKKTKNIPYVWKSLITTDTTTSQGVTVKRWHVNKFSHEYKTSSNQTEFMYYERVVVVFGKTASSTPYFPHVENNMVQAGSGVYPTDFNKYYLIVYDIRSETMDLTQTRHMITIQHMIFSPERLL